MDIRRQPLVAQPSDTRVPNGQGVEFHGANGTVARTNNYTYAGNGGDVYCKDSNGNWSQYNNGSWNPVDTTAAKQQAQQRLGEARQSVESRTWQGLNNADFSRQSGQPMTQVISGVSTIWRRPVSAIIFPKLVFLQPSEVLCATRNVCDHFSRGTFCSS